MNVIEYLRKLKVTQNNNVQYNLDKQMLDEIIDILNQCYDNQRKKDIFEMFWS